MFHCLSSLNLFTLNFVLNGIVFMFNHMYTGVKGEDDYSPLQLACWGGNLELVQYLAEDLKCNVGELLAITTSNQCMCSTWTSMSRNLLISNFRHAKCIQLVLDTLLKLHDIKYFRYYRKNSYACFHAHKYYVTDALNMYKATPLHLACIGGHKEIAQYLVEKLKCITGKFSDKSYLEIKDCCN